jgi:hypothetical protein
MYGTNAAFKKQVDEEARKRNVSPELIIKERSDLAYSTGLSTAFASTFLLNLTGVGGLFKKSDELIQLNKAIQGKTGQAAIDALKGAKYSEGNLKFAKSTFGEMLQEGTEELAQELLKAQETLRKAEHTIVQLKKEKVSIDIDAIKKDIADNIKEEIKPTLESVKSFAQIQKENEELKEALNSKNNQTGSAGGYSVKADNTSKPVPTDYDVKQANKYFEGDMDKWMKYKIKQLN